MLRVVLISAALLASAAARSEDRTFEQQLDASPTGRVEISNVAGLVEVSGWDQPKVEVRAVLDRGIERVSFTSDRGLTSIKVIYPEGGRRGQEATLRVRIPKGSDLSVTATSADVRSTGIVGEQRLSTVSGDIVADISGRNIEVKTVSGDTTLRGDRKPARLRVTSVSGDIRLERGAGEIDATTVSGDLTAAVDSARSIRVRTTSGDVAVTGSLVKDAVVQGETISGGLSVHMKAANGFRYEATTFSGSIDNCFDAEAKSTSAYGPGSRLSGTRGQGQGEVRLKTLSGDVDLCDR